MILFQNPQYLVLMLVLPLIVFFHIISMRSLKKRAIKFANFKAISKIRGVELFSKNLVPVYVYIFVITLIIFSLSGLSFSRFVETNNVSFVVTLDVSRSMGADDIEPNRLEAGKKATKDFLDILPEKTDVGLVTFSSSPHIRSDLTDDKKLLKGIIDDVSLEDYGGTDVLNSIKTASTVLHSSEGGSVLLISDGRVNINRIPEIISEAQESNLIIHSLNVGTSSGGKGDFGENYRGSNSTLSQIAEETGGVYFDITSNSDFYDSFSQILHEVKKRDVFNLSPYLLVVAIFCLLFFYILYNTRYRILP